MEKIKFYLLKIIRNFYLLVLAFFVCWITFIDSNDLITQVEMHGKKKQLLEVKEFYKKKIEEVKNNKLALENNTELLEKLAREKYFLKKDAEDLYIVVQED